MKCVCSKLLGFIQGVLVPCTCCYVVKLDHNFKLSSSVYFLEHNIASRELLFQLRFVFWVKKKDRRF